MGSGGEGDVSRGEGAASEAPVVVLAGEVVAAGAGIDAAVTRAAAGEAEEKETRCNSLGAAARSLQLRFWTGVGRPSPAKPDTAPRLAEARHVQRSARACIVYAGPTEYETTLFSRKEMEENARRSALRWRMRMHAERMLFRRLLVPNFEFPAHVLRKETRSAPDLKTWSAGSALGRIGWGGASKVMHTRPALRVFCAFLSLLVGLAPSAARQCELLMGEARPPVLQTDHLAARASD